MNSESNGNAAGNQAELNAWRRARALRERAREREFRSKALCMLGRPQRRVLLCRMALLSTPHFASARKLIKNMSITGWIKKNGNKLIKLSLWAMIKRSFFSPIFR